METSAFLEFVRLVVAGDGDKVSRRLLADPVLATMASPRGATRQDATDYFFTEISHYIYAGDTALHMAASAFSRPMAELIVSHGADCRAKNQVKMSKQELIAMIENAGFEAVENGRGKR